MVSRQYWGEMRKIILIAATLTLFGCAGDDPIPEGRIGHIRAYFGGVTADEPHAALIGRDVLSAGGAAADAVTAMAFGLMVTRPDAAGAGGGGLCLAYDPRENRVDAIEFLPHPSRSRPPAGRWIGTAPGSFRGLFAFHARFGKLRWEQMVFPAERLARFGVDASKALVQAIDAQAQFLQRTASLRGQFFPGGKKLEIRDRITQSNLAGTLGRIRAVGPGEFYEGRLSREYIDAIMGAGGWLDPEDLRRYRPRWLKPETGKFGNHDLHFAPSPALGGQVAAQLWRALGNRSSFNRASEPQRLAALANAAHRAYAVPAIGSSGSQASAGVAAMDRAGGSAACVLTMNRAFGVGRIAGDTGIIPVPPADLDATLGIVPVIATNPHTTQSYLAATGSGDRFAPLSLVSVLLRIQNSPVPNLDAAISLPRVAPLSGNQTMTEATGSREISAIRGTGRQTVSSGPRGISSVNVMICTDGVRRTPRSCRVHADHRRGAYAVNAEGP